MILGAPGTSPMVFMSTAGLTPYQHAGAGTPWAIALRDTEPPIEPETYRRTGTPPLSSSAQATSSRVSLVDALLPHESRWKSEAATIQPLRTSDCSQGSSMRLST